MSTASKIAGHTANAGPSLVKEIFYQFYGLSLGLLAGGLWKIHHWNYQKRTREFYDLLDKGIINVVVEED